MEEEYIIPELICTVSTYELIGDKWICVLSHSFHGSTQEEIYSLIEAHRKSDHFFDSSFDGMFLYDGGIIYLKNSDIKISFP